MEMKQNPMISHVWDGQEEVPTLVCYRWEQRHYFLCEHEIQVKEQKKATNPQTIFSYFSKSEVRDYDVYFETPTVIPTRLLPEGVVGGTIHPHLIGISDA